MSRRLAVNLTVYVEDDYSPVVSALTALMATMVDAGYDVETSVYEMDAPSPDAHVVTFADEAAEHGVSFDPPGDENDNHHG